MHVGDIHTASKSCPDICLFCRSILGAASRDEKHGSIMAKVYINWFRGVVGYHFCLTHRRSPVRARAKSIFCSFFSSGVCRRLNCGPFEFRVMDGCPSMFVLHVILGWLWWLELQVDNVKKIVQQSWAVLGFWYIELSLSLSRFPFKK